MKIKQKIKELKIMLALSDETSEKQALKIVIRQLENKKS